MKTRSPEYKPIVYEIRNNKVRVNKIINSSNLLSVYYMLGTDIRTVQVLTYLIPYQFYYYLHLNDENIKVQTAKVTYSKSHS